MSTPCQHTHKELTALIRSRRKQVFYVGPQSADEINMLESRLNLRLPSDYRLFLGNYGALRASDLVIFGLGDRDKIGRSVGDLAIVLRLKFPSFAKYLLPIESFSGSRFACLLCSPNDEDFGCVVEVNLAQSDQPLQWRILGPCFRDYLVERLLTSQPVGPDTDQAAWDRFGRHVQEYQQAFGYDHAKGGKLPRNTDWRPYRYCIQDVVFGLTVVRHDQKANRLEVDVYLTADIPEYGPMAGARALTAFLLSEAYKCGGSMEIRFTDNVEGGQVPRELQELAQLYGAEISQPTEGRIPAQEAKALYAAMTGLSEQLQQEISRLEAAGSLTMARACFVVHHGVWTKEQLEMIVLGSENPESVLGGRARPEQRHLYYHDLLHARAALLAGMFERILGQRTRASEQGIDYDMEDDFRSLEIGFDDSAYAKRYRCSEPFILPWLVGAEGDHTIPENMAFSVLVRARDAADLRSNFERDLSATAEWRAANTIPAYVLVPADFMELPAAWKTQVTTKARDLSVGILMCPEPTLAFDADAAQRLARSRVLRQ